MSESWIMTLTRERCSILAGTAVGWSRLRSDLSRSRSQRDNRLDRECLQISIDTGGSFAALRDCPHDKGLPAAHVARREHPGNGRHVILIRGHVAAIVELNSQLLDHPVAHRTEESHRDQDEVGVHHELAASDGFELWRRANPYGVKLPDVTVFITSKFARRYAPVANAAFFVSRFDAELHGPQWPRRLR